MSGLDDLLGSLTKSAGGSGQGGGGLDDLLGGLLGGGTSGGSGGGGRRDILGGLLGGSSGGSPGTAAGGMNLGALAAALGPLLAKLLQGGGLSKLLGNARPCGRGVTAHRQPPAGRRPLEATRKRAGERAQRAGRLVGRHR